MSRSRNDERSRKCPDHVRDCLRRKRLLAPEISLDPDLVRIKPEPLTSRDSVLAMTTFARGRKVMVERLLDLGTAHIAILG